MANPEHLEILRRNVEEWNKWREANPDVWPNLSKADLSGADFNGANLSKAKLSGAKLEGADLIRANLSKAELNVSFRYRVLTQDKRFPQISSGITPANRRDTEF